MIVLMNINYIYDLFINKDITNIHELKEQFLMKKYY